MKSFYNEYKDDEEFVHLGAQLPWKHNVSLIEKVKDKSVRKWYMEKCIEQSLIIALRAANGENIEDKDDWKKNLKLMLG